MVATITRTGKTVELFAPPNLYATAYQKSASDIWERNGYAKINPTDIENFETIQWEGIEFNRLISKAGVLYRFNFWRGEYPYLSIEIEEIGKIE